MDSSTISGHYLYSPIKYTDSIPTRVHFVWLPMDSTNAMESHLRPTVRLHSLRTQANQVVSWATTKLFQLPCMNDLRDRGLQHGTNFRFLRYAFDVDPKSQAFKNRRVFAYVDTGIADGIDLDDKGNVFSGTNDGVQVQVTKNTFSSLY